MIPAAHLTGARGRRWLPADIIVSITVSLVEKKKQRDYLLLLFPALILIAIGWVVVWSNHFTSGFHYDDFPTIIDNQTLHHPGNSLRFFVNPRISSVEKDSAFYRPLLSVWFAFDYWLSGDRPFMYQLENWIWFALCVLMLFLLFRALPGMNGYGAGFAALLFSVHPVTADTVNYVLQRGTIFGTFCVACGLLIFIYWPWRLPRSFR